MINAAPQRLYLMQLGTTTVPLAAGQTLAKSSGSYLVQTSDGKNILIDSGLPADYQPPPGTPPAENERNVLEHLTDLGLGPSDIDLLICTHFDVDHAGYHDAFAQAELIVQRVSTGCDGAGPLCFGHHHPGAAHGRLDCRPATGRALCKAEPISLPF